MLVISMRDLAEKQACIYKQLFLRKIFSPIRVPHQHLLQPICWEIISSELKYVKQTQFTVKHLFFTVEN